MKKKIFSICLVLSVCACIAQPGTFTLGAEMRPRLIVDNGYKIPKPTSSSAQAYVTQRTRLNASFTKQQISSLVSIQDIRYWGDDDNYKENGVFGNTNSLSIHQAWFAIDPLSNIRLKIGRQIFKYDDQRILSSRGWNDYQVTYDAVLLQLKDSTTKLDFALSWNTASNKNYLLPDEKFRTYDFLRLEKQIANLNVSAIAVLTGNNTSDTTETLYFRASYGANVLFEKKPFSSKGSFYFQHNVNDSGEKLRAYCFSVSADRTFFNGKALLAFGLDYLSGQNDYRTDNNYVNTTHRFNILYGRRHAYYGYMDYYSTTPTQGLQDYMLKTKFALSKAFSMNIDYHQFFHATDMANPQALDEKMNKNLGSEIDLTLHWNLLKSVNVEAGYALYFLTETTKAIKSVSNEKLKQPQFAYVTLECKL